MRLRLTAIATLLLALTMAVPATHAQLAASSVPERWIVRLAAPPLAQYQGDEPAYAIQSLQGRLQVEAPAAQEYIAELQRQQAQVFQAIAAAFPGARLQRQYQVVFNGMAVQLPERSPQVLRRLWQTPGVAAVYPDRTRKRLMFDSIPLIKADTLWSNPGIGGQANAGAGIKIAVIDAGIKVDNPFFNAEGFSFPEGYPKGESDFTSPKVIAARAYFNPNFPPLPGDETPEPSADSDSHGTHVAGTAAGDANTQATVDGLQLTISGVAPQAYLMNYKTFYSSELGPNGTTAFDAEFILALEDAVKDGADVINNSWGSDALADPRFDPVVQAAEAAWDAGVVVVFANGNEGPSLSSTGNPPYSDKVISVGASTTDRLIVNGTVDVTTPEGAPEALLNQPFGRAGFGPQIADAALGPLPYLPVSAAGGSSLGCESLPEGAFAGQIVLIERGICEFSSKVLNAQQAGAAAVIVYNSEAGGNQVQVMGPGAVADQVTIPSVFVGRATGLGLIEWQAQHGTAAQLRIDPQAKIIDQSADTLVQFSSRGPTFQGSLKPDVVAPGFNIVSAGYGDGEGLAVHRGFGAQSGTSMAAPHVAGAAALLLQLHPDWTPDDVKSALMSTANPDVWLDQERTRPAGVLDRGAGRINLEAAANPGLLFDRPALAFGRLPTTSGQPTRATLSVTARNAAGTAQTYSLGSRPGPGITISVAPASLSLAAGASAQFEVTIEIAADSAAADYEGFVELSGGSQLLRLPVWARTLPAEKGAKVLLLDNDGSSSLGLPDYSGYYGNILSEQNIAFYYLDADALAGEVQTLPGIGELQRYEIVLWFTGDNFVADGQAPLRTPLTTADQYGLIAYLQGGGFLIATGQDLFSASQVGAPLYGGYLNAIPVQDDVFGEASPSERQVVGGAPEDEGFVGLSSVDEPTLEEPEPAIPYRSIYLSFGLEGVRDDTGTTTRKELLQHLLYWTVDRPSVTLSGSSEATVGQQLTFSAQAQTNTPTSFTSYRWDLGDGSPIQETAAPSISYSYAEPGEYQVRVETVNGWGHRALSSTGITVTGGAGSSTTEPSYRAARAL